MASKATKKRTKATDQVGQVGDAFAALVEILKPPAVPAHAFTVSMVARAIGKGETTTLRRLVGLFREGTLMRGGHRGQYYWFTDPAKTAAGLRRLETRLQKERRS